MATPIIDLTTGVVRHRGSRGKEANVARQTPIDKAQRWVKKMDPRPKGLSKAKRKLKKLEVPRAKGISRAASKLKKLEMPTPKGGLSRVSERLKKAEAPNPKRLSKASKQAEVPSPREVSKAVKRRRREEKIEAKLRPKKRRRTLRSRLVRLASVSSLGALAMYLLDPEHGQARREKMSKKVDEALNANLSKDKKSGPGSS
jgi:hypothetical protein